VDSDIASIKALVFDVFGTVVDWRGSIIREGQTYWTQAGVNIDWVAFADNWRAWYQPAMNEIRQGRKPWATIDELHRGILDRLLRQFSIMGLDEAQVDHLNRVWHRLDPWPDAREGLNRIRQTHITATLSNGNMALLVNLSRYGCLTWDCVLSAELAQRYKPDPEVYRMSARLLGLRPQQVMMVAAHTQDLIAARKAGMRTAFVHRPLEFGPLAQPDEPDNQGFDLVAADFNDLAEQLN
jgi:2-haloacid dehalogenase